MTPTSDQNGSTSGRWGVVLGGTPAEGASPERGADGVGADWLRRGLAQAQQGDAAGAEVAYRIALASEPRSALAWQALGLLMEQERRFPEAIECYFTVVNFGGGSSIRWANLAKLLHQSGRIAESIRAYTEAVRLDPENRYFYEMLRRVRFVGSVLETASIEEAVKSYCELGPGGEPESGPDLASLFHAAFDCLNGFGHREAALRLGRKHLALWPQDTEMTYLMQAAAGAAGLDRAPARYLTEHFDAFAEGFDRQLVGSLGYDLPQKLRAAIHAAAPDGAPYDALDAGCGTGLCGPLLRASARRLIGVDLAPKMLAQAAKRGMYDELVCEELIVYLHRAAGHFDLMVAADVLVYLGDLAPVFAAAAIGLRPGGILAFSTERLAAGTYQVFPSGRFGHAASYVRQLAAGDFRELALVETTVRWERSARVPGQIFVFRRR